MSDKTPPEKWIALHIDDNNWAYKMPGDFPDEEAAKRFISRLLAGQNKVHKQTYLAVPNIPGIREWLQTNLYHPAF